MKLKELYNGHAQVYEKAKVYGDAEVKKGKIGGSE